MEYCNVQNIIQDIDENKLKLVGNRIRELRLKNYSSYETFANDFNLDRKQYWRSEKGSNLTLISLIKIAKIHNISLEELFKGL